MLILYFFLIVYKITTFFTNSYNLENSEYSRGIRLPSGLLTVLSPNITYPHGGYQFGKNIKKKAPTLNR